MDTLLHKYLDFVCLKWYLHESHVIPFRIPHTRSEIVPCIVPFLLYSFTRGSNVTFLSFPPRTVYRSYDRDSEKKASPAFRFSAWCSSCFCNKSREKKKQSIHRHRRDFQMEGESRGSIESKTRSLDAIGSCEPATLDCLFHSSFPFAPFGPMCLAFFSSSFYPFCPLLTLQRSLHFVALTPSRLCERRRWI